MELTNNVSTAETTGTTLVSRKFIAAGFLMYRWTARRQSSTNPLPACPNQNLDICFAQVNAMNEKGVLLKAEAAYQSTSLKYSAFMLFSCRGMIGLKMKPL